MGCSYFHSYFLFGETSYHQVSRSGLIYFNRNTLVRRKCAVRQLTLCVIYGFKALDKVRRNETTWEHYSSILASPTGHTSFSTLNAVMPTGQPA